MENRVLDSWQGIAVRPLLKWPGGKQWLAPALATMFRMSGAEAIIEPFAGGASLFFAARPEHAVLCDTNKTLISTYQALRRTHRKVSAILDLLEIDRETFYRVRSLQPTSNIEAAARMIYLNRTAFGGIWRVNMQGQFNVPFGCKPETRLPTGDQLAAYSKFLRTTDLMSLDFEESLNDVRSSCLVYCDPPYTVTHNNNGFLRYNEKIFCWRDQQRLARICNSLALAGKHVIVSNAAHQDVLRLYEKRLFYGFVLARPSNLAANVQYRTISDELLLVSRSIAPTRKHISSAFGDIRYAPALPRDIGLKW